MKLSGITQKPWYKWCVALGCFLMIFLGLGFCSSNKSLYLGAITDALDMKRSLFSLQDTLRFIVTAVVNMCFGVFVSKLGARKMVLFGFAGYVAYLGISIFAENIILFYLAGCCLGIGTAFCSTAMASHLISQWLPEKRGPVSGVVMCANGLGGLIAAQIITPMIDGSKFGYRDAYTFALVVSVLTGIAVFLLVSEPKGAKVPVAKKKAKGKLWTGISFEEALKKPYFYVALLGVFLTGMSLQGIHGISATHIQDVGIDSDFKKMVVSLSSLVLIFSKFATGFSYDKFGLRITMLFCECCAVIGFLSLAFCGPTSLGQGLAVSYSVFSSLALPLETVVIPLLVADLFGEKAFSKLMGIFIGFNYAGYALGGFVCNWSYDLSGSYNTILVTLGVMMAVIAVAYQFVLSAANKTRKQVEAQLEFAE